MRITFFDIKGIDCSRRIRLDRPNSNVRILLYCHISVAFGSVVVKALCYKPEGRGFETRRGEFLIYLFLPAALGPGVHSVSNKNEYQNQKNNNVSEE
jgi:hypothetical protein